MTAPPTVADPTCQIERGPERALDLTPGVVEATCQIERGPERASGLTPGVVEAEVVWTLVCRLEDLVPERGAAALVGGEQVAVFRLADDRVLAVQQLDPFSGAHVLSRGIVGSRGDVATLASPMYKQVFDLRTGRCVEPLGREPRDLRSWPVRVEDRSVLIGSPVAVSTSGAS